MFLSINKTVRFLPSIRILPGMINVQCSADDDLFTSRQTEDVIYNVSLRGEIPLILWNKIVWVQVQSPEAFLVLGKSVFDVEIERKRFNEISTVLYRAPEVS